MKITRKMAFWRPGYGGMSLARTWAVLLIVATLLVMIDLRVLWQQTDTPGHDRVSATLHDGYGHSSVRDVLHRQSGGEEDHPLLLHDTRESRRRDVGGGSLLVARAGAGGGGGGGQRPVDINSKDQKINIHDLLSDIEDKVEDNYIKKMEEDGEGVGWVDTGVPREELLQRAGRQAEDLLRYVQSVNRKPYSKWIVLDVTSGTCEKVLTTTPSGWKIIAIGDAASLKGCSTPTCTYLPPDLSFSMGSQQQNGKALPSSSTVVRKNLAYLTAISQGAEYVLDADCSTSVWSSLKTLQFPPLKDKDHGPMYNESLLFNPYAHFGAWAAVPLTLSGATRAGPNSWMYYVRDFDNNVLVKHGISDSSDDVSSVDGTLKNSGGKAAGMRFDSSTPAVFLGQRSFSAAVPVVSLYRQSALWSLLLPCSEPSLRCRVLRQLIQQRLFRELDAFSGFYQVKSSKSQDARASSDADLERSQRAADVENLVSLLNAWKCRSSLKFSECLNVLSDFLRQKKRVSDDEFTFMKAWVKVLGKVDGGGGVSAATGHPARLRSPWRGVRKTSEVRVTLGSIQTRLESGGAEEERLMKSRLVDPLTERCHVPQKDSSWFPVAQWKKPVIEDIVLIIVFNWNVFFWNNLPFTETMHRPFFKHIFYCVPNIDELLAGNKDDVLRHVSFVEGLSDTWYFMYECVTIVAQMNIQGVRGYLQIGDDTLTNSWKYLKAPRDSMWIPSGFTTMRADEESHSWSWYWWKKSRGRPAAVQSMADLEQISGLTPEQLLKLDPNYEKLKATGKNPVRSFLQMYQAGKAGFPPMQPMLPGSELWTTPTREEAAAFLDNYYRANRLSGRLKHRALDFFYIPQALVDGWVKFTHHFLRRNVLIELAVPAVHYGLAPHSDTKYVLANSLWKRDRNVSYSFYDDAIYFLHPFKMKAHMEQKESSTFFCQEYMSILFTELKKLASKG